MGKKRRMLSATKKFAAKHSNHPRMRAILAASETETVTKEPVIKVVAPTPKTVAKVEVAPVLEAAPVVPPKEVEATVPELKAKTTTKTTFKKRSTTRKPRRKSTKTKTIDANT